MNQQHEQSNARQASDAVDTVVDGVHSIARDMKQSARQCMRDTNARGRLWEHGLEGVVAAKPLTTVLVAVGIGFIASTLWHRRHS